MASSVLPSSPWMRAMLTHASASGGVSSVAFRNSPSASSRRPETDMGDGVVGVESYRLLERQDGVLVAAGPAVGAAERQVGIGIFRRFFRKLKRFFDGNRGDVGRSGARGGFHGCLRGRLRMSDPRHEEYCNGAPKGDTFSESTEQDHGCL